MASATMTPKHALGACESRVPEQFTRFYIVVGHDGHEVGGTSRSLLDVSLLPDLKPLPFPHCDGT